MDMNLSYARTNVFLHPAKLRGSELNVRFTKDSMDIIQL